MDLAVYGFDWDEGNSAKCKSHGGSIAEIEGMFRDDPYVAPDWAYSLDESRLLAIGVNRRGRHIFVMFTLRQRNGQPLIRPITARYMHAREIRRYEAAGS